MYHSDRPQTRHTLSELSTAVMDVSSSLFVSSSSTSNFRCPDVEAISHGYTGLNVAQDVISAERNEYTVYIQAIPIKY